MFLFLFYTYICLINHCQCIVSGIPTVAAESEISDIQYGLNHTIACTISSVPAYTTVYWIKITNGSKTNITYNSLGFDGATLNRPSLTILKAKPADNGEYICNALNEAGHGWSNSITITVFGSKFSQTSLCQSLLY